MPRPIKKTLKWCEVCERWVDPVLAVRPLLTWRMNKAPKAKTASGVDVCCDCQKAIAQGSQPLGSKLSRLMLASITEAFNEITTNPVEQSA